MPPDEMPPDQRGLYVLEDEAVRRLVGRVLTQDARIEQLDEQIEELQRRLDESRAGRDGFKWLIGAWVVFFGALLKFVEYFRRPPGDNIG